MDNYEDQYLSFVKGIVNIKLGNVGIHDDAQNRSKLAEFHCFYFTKSHDELISPLGDSIHP